MTPSGIEPATFRILAQCLNQLRHCLPPRYSDITLNVRSNIKLLPNIIRVYPRVCLGGGYWLCYKFIIFPAYKFKNNFLTRYLLHPIECKFLRKRMTVVCSFISLLVHLPGLIGTFKYYLNP